VASGTPSPSADVDGSAAADGDAAGGDGRTTSVRHWRWLVPDRIRRLGPKTLQGRLTLGFAGVVAITLLLVTAVVLNRLDYFFRQQQMTDLNARTELVA